MARQGKATGITINLADEGRLSMLKTILGYEAGVRGLTIGQTLVQLIMEAADTSSYPEEVRVQLDEIEDRRARRAVECSLKAAS